MSRVSLNVPNISCGHCERTIKNALTPVEGVRKIDVDIANQQVSVDFDETIVGLERIEQILADEDYPVAAESGDRSEASTGTDETVEGCACCAA